MQNPLLVAQTTPQSLIINFKKMRLSVLKWICKNKTDFYVKTDIGVHSYLNWSFSLDHEYTPKYRNDNPWTA